MKLIGPGARYGRHHGTGHAAILRRKVAGFYPKFLQRVRVGQRVSIVTDAGHIASAIQEKAHHGNAAVNASVDDDLCRGHADLVIGCAAGIAVATRAVGLHARGEREFRIGVAVHQRQPDDLGRLHGSSEHGGCGIDKNGGSRDRIFSD